MKTLKHQNGWVFGPMADLIVFTFPLLLTMAFHSVTHALALGAFFYISLIFFDAIHVYSTFTYTYTSPTTWRRHRNWLVVVPVFFLILNTTMHIVDVAFFWLFFSTWSIYHFLKQSTAWFHVSAGMGVSRDPLTIKIDRLAIFAATFGMAFTSLCAPHSMGWYSEFDLLQLPENFYYPILGSSLICICLYPVRHFQRSLRGEKQNWAAHHIFLTALILWGGIRVLNVQSLGFATITTHAFPYLYLGYKMVTVRIKHGEKFYLRTQSFKNLILVMLGLAVLGAAMEMVGRYSPMVKGHFPLFSILAVIFNSISLTHYTLDMFTWNRHHNPEWIEALGKEVVKPSVERLDEAA